MASVAVCVVVAVCCHPPTIALDEFSTTSVCTLVPDLRDGDGTFIGENDNWMDGPDTPWIAAVGLTPPAPAESALFGTVTPGAYTAIITGADGGIGVALLEIYNVQLP